LPIRAHRANCSLAFIPKTSLAAAKKLFYAFVRHARKGLLLFVLVVAVALVVAVVLASRYPKASALGLSAELEEKRL
jgi:uncharacterized transporter YbjL